VGLRAIAEACHQESKNRLREEVLLDGFTIPVADVPYQVEVD
jgi:hypothetical protein